MTRRLFAPCAPLIARRTLLAGLGSTALVPARAFPADAPKPAKPPVPPGRDPGGVMVALIGSGIDYTRPDIAPRLARDGEGHLVGWDFIDGDRSPYSRNNWSTAAARIILAEAPAARLAVFSVQIYGPHDESPELANIARAISMAAATPARAVLLQAWLKERSKGLLNEAARRFPRQLIITLKGSSSRPPDRSESNLLMVGDCRSTGAPNDEGYEHSGPDFDVLAGIDDTWPQGAAEAFDGGHALGAPRLAALAARVAAIEPNLDGAGLAARVVALGEPNSASLGPSPARFGCIREPRRHFWPE
jgi:hypothetical protein